MDAQCDNRMTVPVNLTFAPLYLLDLQTSIVEAEIMAPTRKRDNTILKDDEFRAIKNVKPRKTH